MGCYFFCISTGFAAFCNPDRKSYVCLVCKTLNSIHYYYNYYSFNFLKLTVTLAFLAASDVKVI